jgi:dCTP deaminase
MILSNVEIFKALDDKRLIIEPEPSPRLSDVSQSHSPYDTHTVDLSLGDEITIPEKGAQIIYDLSAPGKIADTIRKHSKLLTISELQPFELKPNQFILGKTRERVELPVIPGLDTCLAARIEGKSSRARFGVLIHFTAPTVHPGFKGTLTLEMINLGPASFMLRPGMAIAQLIIEEVKGLPIENPSQFQGQSTPAGC